MYCVLIAMCSYLLNTSLSFQHLYTENPECLPWTSISSCHGDILVQLVVDTVSYGTRESHYHYGIRFLAIPAMVAILVSIRFSKTRFNWKQLNTFFKILTKEELVTADTTLLTMLLMGALANIFRLLWEGFMSMCSMALSRSSWYFSGTMS